MKKQFPKVLDRKIDYNTVLKAYIKFYKNIPSISDIIEDHIIADLTDLAVFAIQLVTGLDFSYFSEDGQNTPDFTELNKTLGVIVEKLDNIQTGVNDILKRVEELPKIIQGEIDMAFLSKALTDQKTHVNNLLFYLSDSATFYSPKNFQTIVSLTVDISDDFNQVLTNTKNGMTGLGMTCGAFAIWAQSTTMLLTIKDYNPNGQTLYDLKIFKDYKDMIYALFGSIENLSQKLNSDLTKIPYNRSTIWKFDEASNSFYPYSINTNTQYEPDLFVAQFSPFDNSDNNKINLYSSLKIGDGTWFSIIMVGSLNKFEHPQYVAKVYEKFTKEIAPYYFQILNFNTAFQELPQIKLNVFNSLNKH